MKKQRFRFSLMAGLALTLTALLPSSAVAQSGNISKTGMAGKYSVTLKVLPAEGFRGSNAAMARDGGARPNFLHGADHPNHHMVAFIKENGSSVDHGNVVIRYRQEGSKTGHWKGLPVVRMHVAGKGMATTHFGNNVELNPDGAYEVRVTVDGKGPATFHFTL